MHKRICRQWHMPSRALCMSRARRNGAGGGVGAVGVVLLVAFERRAEDADVMLGAADVEAMPVVRADHIEDARPQRPCLTAREVGHLALAGDDVVRLPMVL